MKQLLLVLVLLLVAMPVSAAFPTSVTTEEIQAKYQNGQTVKVLIMPGHEPTYGGAEENGLRERDIVVTISQKLAAQLRTDPRFEVTIARDQLAWHRDLEVYFKENWKSIERYVKAKKKEMQRLIRKGELEDREFEVEHNTAATDVALRLYGINKWANENEYDIVIHPHLNDNVGATNHSGFAVYVPDTQFGNARASRALGESIAAELNQFSASSTLPIENYALVEDQDLIALGAYNTSESAVTLIEYAYIYESKIKEAGARDAVLSDMAYQTYRGIRDYVGAPVLGDNTLSLPYLWQVGPLTVGSSGAQVYALQAALHSLGFYPPKDQLLIGCPISGYVGECTTQALKAFQASKGLEQTGSIGPRTKAALQAAGF